MASCLKTMKISSTLTLHFFFLVVNQLHNHHLLCRISLRRLLRRRHRWNGHHHNLLCRLHDGVGQTVPSGELGLECEFLLRSGRRRLKRELTSHNLAPSSLCRISSGPLSPPPFTLSLPSSASSEEPETERASQAGSVKTHCQSGIIHSGYFYRTLSPDAIVHL